MKIKCSRCRLLRDQCEFFRDDKEYKTCNMCRDYNKEYSDNNKEKAKEYRENNKEKKQDYNKEYYQNNKEKIQEYRIEMVN